MDIAKKMEYAYQIFGSSGFMGIFPEGTFENPEQTTLFLGKNYKPVAGRDKVRDSDGNLKIYSDVLLAYPLDHSRQNEIIIPACFEDHKVQMVGVGPVGLEVAVQLVKIGLKNLTVYDPTLVLEEDLAVSGIRVVDPNRSRVETACEIIRMQTLRVPQIFSRYPKIEDMLGNVVINTSSDIDVRRDLWKLVRGNPKVELFIDVQVNGYNGRLFIVDPHDEGLYSEELSQADQVNGEIIWVNTLFACFVVGAFQRFVRNPRFYFNKMYVMDMENFYYGSNQTFSRISQFNEGIS